MKRNIVRVVVVVGLVACGWVLYDQVSGEMAEAPQSATPSPADGPIDNSEAAISEMAIPETLESPPAVATRVATPMANRYTIGQDTIARGQEPSSDQFASETASVEAASAEPPSYGGIPSADSIGASSPNTKPTATVLASGTQDASRYGVAAPAAEAAGTPYEPNALPPAGAESAGIESDLGDDRSSASRRLSPPAPLNPATQLSRTVEEPQMATLPTRNTTLPRTIGEPPADNVAIKGGVGFESADGTGRPGSKRLEGPQTPQIAVQKFAPAEIQVGKECVFEIKVRNTGEVAAQRVTVYDEIPQGTRLVRTTPEAVRTADGRIVWELGTLGAGDQANVEMRLMPTDEGEIGSVATVKFESQASVRTKSTRPALAVRLTVASEKVMIGDDVSVKIEISNPGTGDATGVTLLENVPDKMTHPAGQALEFELGTLAAGETREMDLVLTAEKSGKVINTLTVRGDASLNVEESIEFEVIAPELEVSISGPKRRFLDRKATYEVSVSNPGTAPAREVELVTRLPEGMKFVEANNSGHYDASTHAVYWSLEELPPKQLGTVELVALPVTSGEKTLRIEGSAQQGLKDKTQQSLSVEGVAAIMFEVVDLNDPIVVGEETTYEIHVVNQGSKEATNIQIVALLPAGLQASSAAGPSGHEITGERVVFEPLRQLAPKADTTYRIKAKGLRDGDQRIHVLLTTDEIKTPVTKEVSTRVYKDE